MVQNHMLQLLCLIAMEPPVSLDADRVRDEKLKVLRALRPIEPHEVPTLTVRGQYTQGAIDGKPVPGYIADLGRRGDQHDRDLRRAEGRGAHLALGRRAVLPAHRQAAAAEGVRDRHPVPRAAVLDLPARRRAMAPNKLIIRLQPEEGMRLEMMTKDPGPGGLRLSPDRRSTSASRRPSACASPMPMSGC